MGLPDKPRVCVVVVNLNGKDYIGEAIRSLQSQTYENLYMIVVDNGSTDESVALIREQFPGVQVVENGRNLGFGGGNNIGMKIAMERGDEFVFLFNYDAIAAEGCVERLVARAVSDRAGMVGPKIFYYHDPSLLWSAGGVIRWWCGDVAHRGIREKDRGQYDDICEVDYLTACAVLIDTGLLMRIGLFDDAYFPSYFEDTDFCQRARRAGCRLVYEPAATVWHRVSSFSGGGTTPLKVTLRFRNQWIFFRRWASWYHWLTIPFCAGMGAALYVGGWAVRGQWHLIRALVRGIAALPRRRTDQSQ